VPSVSRTKRPIHLGLDVHKDSISVAILHPDSEAVDVERIFHDETSVRGTTLDLGVRVPPSCWGRNQHRGRRATGTTSS